MKIRVALASSSGDTVDMHFGKAVAFEVYDVTPEGYEFIDRRSAFSGGPCDESQFDRVADKLSDCGAVVAARFGPPAVQCLLTRGIRAFEALSPVEQILEEFRAQAAKPEPAKSPDGHSPSV